MSYWLHPEAEIEFTDAALYYAEHASNIIANAFVTEFERVVALLEPNQKLGTRQMKACAFIHFTDSRTHWCIAKTIPGRV